MQPPRGSSCPEMHLFPSQDPQYIQQALTNVLLMDAVVGTLQSPNAIYAASKLSYFDKMKSESKSSWHGAQHTVGACWGGLWGCWRPLGFLAGLPPPDPLYLRVALLLPRRRCHCGFPLPSWESLAAVASGQSSRLEIQGRPPSGLWRLWTVGDRACWALGLLPVADLCTQTVHAWPHVPELHSWGQARAFSWKRVQVWAPGGEHDVPVLQWWP